MTDEELRIHNLFLETFSSYQFSGVEIAYTNKSITFNFNERNLKYVENLLLKLYDMDSIIIIFRSRGKNVSFTSSSMSVEELFKLIKENMDSIKFLTYETYRDSFSQELNNIYSLFEKATSKNMDLTIGITNKDNDKLFKLVSKNYSVQETFKRVGLPVREHATYFRKSKFNDISQVFESIRTNPLVYYYQPSDVKKSGFISNFSIIFCLIVDILSIALGIYLLTR